MHTQSNDVNDVNAPNPAIIGANVPTDTPTDTPVSTSAMLKARYAMIASQNKAHGSAIATVKAFGVSQWAYVGQTMILGGTLSALIADQPHLSNDGTFKPIKSAIVGALTYGISIMREDGTLKGKTALEKEVKTAKTAAENVLIDAAAGNREGTQSSEGAPDAGNVANAGETGRDVLADAVKLAVALFTDAERGADARVQYSDVLIALGKQCAAEARARTKETARYLAEQRKAA